jgi:adenylate cyclase
MPANKRKTLPRDSDERLRITESGFSELFARLRKRRIIETLAAFIGGGWLLLEFVHWILVDHYHFPEKTIDITFATLLGALLGTLIWRWFSGREKRTRFKPEAVLIPLVLFITIILDINLILHLKPVASETFTAPKWKNSIAVLPFENISQEKDQDYFCNGLTDELITRLSHIKQLKVIAKTSVFSLKEKDIREIGKMLDVATVLEGGVRKSGNKLRITAQLINAADASHMWSDIYERELTDLFAIQDEIALSVASQLRLTLLGEERSRLTKSGTSDVNSYQLYLKGKYYRYEELPKEMLIARDYFEEAIRQDPNFAAAYAGLAEDYMVLGLYSVLPRDEAAAKAKAAVRKALELDDELSEAHVSAGVIKMVFDLDWKGAEADFKRAIVLNPNNFDAYREYALLLFRTFLYDESEKAFRHGQTIDPYNPVLMRDLRILYVCRGENGKAEDIKKQLLNVRPDWADYGEDSFYMVEKIKARIQAQGRTPWSMAYLAIAYAKSVNPGEASKLIQELGSMYDQSRDGNIALHLALIADHLGKKEKALTWLDRALENKAPGLINISACFWFKSLQSDPRYQAILKKIGVK